MAKRHDKARYVTIENDKRYSCSKVMGLYHFLIVISLEDPKNALKRLHSDNIKRKTKRYDKEQ